MSNKKLLLLFCGGTISMRTNEAGALKPHHGAQQLFEIEPRLQELAAIDTVEIANIDSSDMSPRHWEQIIMEIFRKYNEYDGFVVTMGTNTLAYCASALSFALVDLGKPVIVTGAQIPAEILASDARNNLVNAIRLACSRHGGVFVVFGSKIILGCRAKKVSESDLDAFMTFQQSDFGQIGISITTNHQDRPAHTRALQVKNGFDERVLCVTLIPGMPLAALQTVVDSGIRGLVLRAYGSGDISSHLFPALRSAQEREIPVVVTTQCPGGATIIGMNDVGLEALQYGIIQAFDMSMESMSTKLMWLLKQNTPYLRFKALMEQDFVGEITPKTAKLNASQPAGI